jgi:signal transduction histidine kinase
LSGAGSALSASKSVSQSVAARVAAPAQRAGQARAGRRRAGPTLLRSAGVRFALIYAILLALSAAALAVFLWWATAGLLDRQTEAAIRADAQGLSERWMEGGLPALLLTIDDRLAQNVDDDAIYLAVDQDMRRLAGNLPHWPASVTEPNVSYPLDVVRAGVHAHARVLRFDLPGDFHLLVGRDMRVRGQLRELLTGALLWALVVVGVMATAGAVIVRTLFRRALARVSETSTAIAAGDFARRVRLSGRGDEFDQLAETINDMLDRIARLMDGVRQVSNSIAHDLRTPITRARAKLEEAAALHASDPAELHAAVERATADLDAIVAVFQALLRIAEIEAGSRRSAFAAFDVVALIDDLADLYTAAAEERGLRLSVAMTAPLQAHGDREMVQQAVANLLDNAIKFSPPGGTVTLTAGPAGPGRILVAVSDSGPGIAPEERARAPERFFRAETARNTVGSGLGLSLVQAVAVLHGGELRLDDAAPGAASPGLRAAITLAAAGPSEGALTRFHASPTDGSAAAG